MKKEMTRMNNLLVNSLSMIFVVTSIYWSMAEAKSNQLGADVVGSIQKQIDEKSVKDDVVGIAYAVFNQDTLLLTGTSGFGN